MPFNNRDSCNKETTDPALIVRFEEQWRRVLGKRLADDSRHSFELEDDRAQLALLNGPKDKYRWVNNLNTVSLIPWDLLGSEVQLRDDVNELTQTEFKGTIPFSRHVMTAIRAHESPLSEDEDDRMVQYKLREALMQDESSPVIFAMNRDARDLLDADTEIFLRGFLPLSPGEDIDLRDVQFFPKLKDVDKESKEAYVQCVTDFLEKLVTNMPPMESQLILMKKESDCDDLIRARLLLHAILGYLKNELRCSGPNFWGPEHPPVVFDGRWDQIKIGHGLDKEYARGVMRHRRRHVKVSTTCSCEQCKALRDTLESVAQEPPAQVTGNETIWEPYPSLLDQLRRGTLDD